MILFQKFLLHPRCYRYNYAKGVLSSTRTWTTAAATAGGGHHRSRQITAATQVLHHHHHHHRCWLSTRPHHQRTVVSSNINKKTVNDDDGIVDDNNSFSNLRSSSRPNSSNNNHHHQQQQQKQPGLTIGILRETYDDWERRTPLGPRHVQQLLLNNNNNYYTKILVQPSSQRCFSDTEYEHAGAIITNDLSSADIVLGVKRPIDPEKTLLDHKTYVFFSHVIKGQHDNQQLLQTVLDKHIQLIDYECIVEPPPPLEEEPPSSTHPPPSSSSSSSPVTKKRLVAFGRYAGLAGMIDTFYPLGRRLVSDYGLHTPFLHCPLASMQHDLHHAKTTLREIGNQIASEGIPPIIVDDQCGKPKQRYEPIVFCLTGHGGRVFGGAMEIMDLIPHERIAVQDLPELMTTHASHHNPDEPYYHVYVVTPTPEDLYRHREYSDDDDGTSSTPSFDRNDWKNHPTEYVSKFATDIAPYIHVLVNGIYWDPRYARLLTKDDVQQLHEQGQTRLKVVSDISCDINGSIEFLDRTCTIANPFFQYNPLTREEVCADIGTKGITVMGTDILPAELPKESSEHFGDAVVKVLDELSKYHASNQSAEDASSSSSSTIDLQDAPPLLSEACITTPKGVLAPRFRYLDSFLKMAPSTVNKTNQSIDVLLNGHLFDSGLINAILDEAEHLQCGFQILNCRVNRGGHAKDVVPTEKSTALVQFYSDDQEGLGKLEKKIETLVGVMDKAEATFKVVDRKMPPQQQSTGSNGGATRQQGSSGAFVESQEEQRVLVLGAGRVSMSLVDLLGRSPRKYIQVASDNEVEAREVAKLAQRGVHVGVDLKNKHQLSTLVADHDVVISLLPAPLHPAVAEACIQHKTNLVTASYESPEMRDFHDRATEAGIIILNEVGLDPGLDHMSAMKIMDDIRARGGGTVRSFRSVCGGLPAPEAANNNPLRYKFSWSPKGVISASQNAARYRWKGETIEVDGHDLMSSSVSFTDAWPELGLECIPNRDSLKYQKIYGLENDHPETIFRGTLRYGGFCDLMSVFQRMGLLENISVIEGPSTWESALAELSRRKGNFQNLDDFLLHCTGGDPIYARFAHETLQWLEMEGTNPLAHPDSVVDSFAAVLEKHLQFSDGERDMVAMHTAIEASFDDEDVVERHQSSLLVYGDASMSAMCRTVGYPAAAAADLVLSSSSSGSDDGALNDCRGLLLPTDKRIYLPILQAVEQEGISFDERMEIV